MTMFQKCVLALAAVAVLLAAWMGRYSVHTIARGGEGGAALGYVLDRWTGRVELLVAVTRRPVTPYVPPEAAPGQ